MKKLYVGKAKIVYENGNDEVIIHFKDDATAGNGAKKESVTGKGVLNNNISTIIFTHLMDRGIKTHFLEQINETDMRCKKVTVIPLEVIVRNRAAGSLVKKYGFPKGTIFETPTVEFSYKNDALGDPLLNDDHAIVLGIATMDELDFIKKEAFMPRLQFMERSGKRRL